MSFTASFQGRLVKVKAHRHSTNKIAPPEHVRGKIKDFSRKSRKRMLELLATVSIPEKTFFVTLTFPDEATPYSGKDAKNMLRALFERMRRRWPESSAVWRMEIKRRKSGIFKGCEVPHFHLLIFNCPLIEGRAAPAQYPQGYLNTAWCEVLGVDYCRTDVQAMKSGRQAAFYCAKYAAKVSEAESPLVSLPYLHDVGRSWGVFNRRSLPRFECHKITVEGHSKAFYDLKRAVRHKIPKIISNRRYQGYSLFTDDADLWLDYLTQCLLE